MNANNTVVTDNNFDVERRLDRTAQVVGKAWSATKNNDVTASPHGTKFVERDIFDAAPFQPPASTTSRPPQQKNIDNISSREFDRQLSGGGSPGHKPKRRAAKKEKHHRSRQSITDEQLSIMSKRDPSRTQSVKVPQQSSPENPFDEFIASRNVVTKTVSHPPSSSTLPNNAPAKGVTNDDPFGMVPMKVKSSGKTQHKKPSNRPDKSSSSGVVSGSVGGSHGDPFNMAPMAVKSKGGSKKKPKTTNLSDDPFGSAPFAPSSRPSNSASSSGDKVRKKRILPEIPK